MSDETSTGRRLLPVIAARSGNLPVQVGMRPVGFVRPLSAAERMDGERDRLFLWTPVAFGSGIAVYFALPREPSLVAVILLCVVAGLAVRHTGFARPTGAIVLGALLAALGLADGTVRARLVAGPVIMERIGPVAVTGRIVSVDSREGGAARLLVAPAELGANLPPPRLLSLWSRGNWAIPQPGTVVSFDAVIMPPPDAAAPGAFDYARQAYFDGIGGVGFIVSAPVPRPSDPPGLIENFLDRVERLRLGIAVRIVGTLPGSPGAVAAALVTGQRGAIPEADQEALRMSGLAHILAISGLHMMLVVGTLFWTVRAALALSPALALTRPIKKWAAIVALAGGAGYLLLSGGSIATQRAFVMAAIMLVAILFDRPAITLRNVAVAAWMVLALTPEALVSASFQMSFAATIALVAAYEAVQMAAARAPDRAAKPLLLFLRRALIGLVFTSLIAGLATGPFAAFHFNRVAVYGLIANVVAMPLVSLVVMPAGLLAVVLMPFGLEAPALGAMGLGIEGVLAVAHHVSGWDGAIRMVPAMPVLGLAAVAAGGLWLSLWRTSWRYLGVPLIIVGMATPWLMPIPDLFVSRDAGMAAVRMDDGGLVFVPRARSQYVAETWLRRVGQPETAQAAATASCDEAGCIAASPRLRVAVVEEPMAFAEDCAWADVVVSELVPPEWCRSDALVFGPLDVARLGAVSVRATPHGLKLTSATELAGDRPWTRRSVSPDEPSD
ncbi:ComEC/Rec2 family competence protein [Microbaculum marinum]|uniref:ComEC/Rec2 family competence protein n=1 Tax=Microbaculum marinum TaxID=1764581 RepID=A0AAW9RY56_9HYPH